MLVASVLGCQVGYARHCGFEGGLPPRRGGRVWCDIIIRCVRLHVLAQRDHVFVVDPCFRSKGKSSRSCAADLDLSCICVAGGECFIVRLCRKIWSRRLAKAGLLDEEGDREDGRCEQCQTCEQVLNAMHDYYDDTANSGRMKKKSG